MLLSFRKYPSITYGELVISNTRSRLLFQYHHSGLVIPIHLKCSHESALTSQKEFYTLLMHVYSIHS